MGKFSLQLEKFKDKVEGRLDLVLQKVALDLTKKVTLKTPVDTGRARASWNVGVNNVDTRMVPEKVSMSQTGAFQKAINRARREIARLIWGDTLYITNNVRYIKYLERGSSTQAPNGMVETTLIDYPLIVKDATREAKQEKP